ncbi:glycoside hydrolase family 73 protein [Aerococcaceae bacterium DSM 111021]|nr:glycoside hydrolase family 73 protein [Aerococcaceae bacterium DSM 111021]
MAKKKKNLFKFKKRPTRRRKSKTNYKKNWNTFKTEFLQKIGILSIFFVIFTLLSGIIIYRWVETANQRHSELIQRELDYEERLTFIETIIPISQRLQRQYGVLASISMAQAALESNFGQSQLGADYNNLYGVKTDASDPDGVDFPTLEFFDDEWIEITDRFKVYPSWEASMENHAILINEGTSWDPTFYHAVLDGDNYEEQAYALQESGYATDPIYAEKLIEMIEAYQLHQYDQPLQ